MPTHNKGIPSQKDKSITVLKGDASTGEGLNELIEYLYQNSQFNEVKEKIEQYSINTYLKNDLHEIYNSITEEYGDFKNTKFRNYLTFILSSIYLING